MIKRRQILIGLMGSGLACAFSKSTFSNELLTPNQMRGPFYPNKIPLDHDNDLTRVVGHDQMATGHISHLIGKVLNPNGNPIVGAQIEIWQCDFFGQYNHPLDGGGEDLAFQGYGRTRSGSNGEYRFKTIKPVEYPGRAPHIHMRIVYGASDLITQLYVENEPLNDRDFILNSIHSAKARSSLVVPFKIEQGYPSDQLVAKFNPVILT